jgi:hypothetical protein
MVFITTENNHKFKFYNIHDKILVRSNLSDTYLSDYFITKNLGDVDIEYNLISYKSVTEYLNKKQNLVKIAPGLYYSEKVDCVISLIRPLGIPVFWSIQGLPSKTTKVVLSDSYLFLSKLILKLPISAMLPVHHYVLLTLYLKLLQKGMMFLLAACIKPKNMNGAILISAQPGMGKTEATLRMINGKAYDYLSDDLTIIDQKGNVYAFPWRITRRHGSIIRRSSVLDPIKLNFNVIKKTKAKEIYIIEDGEDQLIPLDRESAFNKLLTISRSVMTYRAERTIIGYEYFNKDFKIDEYFNREQKILHGFLKNVQKNFLLRCKQSNIESMLTNRKLFKKNKSEII